MDEATAKKKVTYVHDQLKGLRDAFVKACPRDELLICARVSVKDENGAYVHSEDVYAHTTISTDEYAHAIFEWANMLGEN